MPETQVVPLAQLDVFLAPPALAGAPANTGYRAVTAETDVDAIRAWLAISIGSPATFESYRKEAERLLLWARLVRQKTLAQLTHEDFLLFREFLKDPQPRELWVSGGGRKHQRSDPRWRPFYQPLAVSSQRQALLILNGMMSWLVDAGYLLGNPLALSRKRTRKSKPRVTRYLSPEVWQDVKDYIEALPRGSEREARTYARARWLFTLLYLGALRLSEVCGNSMSCFQSRRGADGQERWWLSILGKGDKTRDVPVSEELLQELKRYRVAHALLSPPTHQEDTPLVIPLKRTGKPLTRSALHLVVKGIFEGAARRLRDKGEAFFSRADLLEQASAHWLRHTAGSHLADQGVDLRVIRDNFGHESIATTSLYLHTEDESRHQVTTDKHKVNW